MIVVAGYLNGVHDRFSPHCSNLLSRGTKCHGHDESSQFRVVTIFPTRNFKVLKLCNQSLAGRREAPLGRSSQTVKECVFSLNTDEKFNTKYDTIWQAKRSRGVM
jgi:hypothetical protein